ncbi:hypothetical protein QO179_08045 [Bacillus stercoris]|nr:hypothetical protein [Bacillus stercoris]
MKEKPAKTANETKIDGRLISMADEKQWTETGLEIAVVGMAGKFERGKY